MGEDPVGTWLAGRRPVAAPAPASDSPETDAALAGTIFADPVRDYLLRQNPTQADFETRHPITSAIGRFAEGVAKPFKNIYDQVESNRQAEMDLIRQGKYGEAAGKLIEPITAPFTGIEATAAGHPPTAPSGEQAAEMAGIPVRDLREAAAKKDYLDVAGQVAGTGAMLALPHLLGLHGPAEYEPPAPRTVFERNSRWSPGGQGLEPVGGGDVGGLPAPIGPEGPVEGQVLRGLLPEHEQPLLEEHARGGRIYTPEAPAPRPELPENAGGPYAQPGDILPPRINEASRFQQPRGAPDPVADWLAKQPAAPEPPAAPPAPVRRRGAAPPPAPVSDEDAVAQALGFPDMASMKARAGQIAPRKYPTAAGELRDVPVAPRTPPPEPPPAEPVAPPEPPPPPAPPAAPELSKVPFPVADAETQARLPREVDYSRPQIQRVPLDKLVATQDTVRNDVVQAKAARGPQPINELPAGANTRPPENLPVVFKGMDGKLYLAGGHHEATAAMLRGDTHMDAVTYPAKGGGGAPPAGEPTGGAPAGEPPAPVAAKPPAPVRAPRRTPAGPPVDPEAEELWQRTLADARQQGYAGTDAELRAKFDENVSSGKNLRDDMQAIRDEYSGTALQQAIRKLGGLSTDDDSAAEIAGARGQKGGAGITRKDGLPFDQLHQELMQDPRFRNLSEHELRAQIEQLGHVSDDTMTPVPSLEEAARVAGIRHGEPWWEEGTDTSFDMPAEGEPTHPLEDLLSTGETQPRLPGDVGNVREFELPTPKEEAPFALDRQNADRTPVQHDALAELLNPKTSTAVEEPPALPTPRHEIRRPESIGPLADSMRERGWVGRPVLVVNDNGRRLAWTATHRLAAAKEAGLTPDKIPTLEVDGEALKKAGYDLADLTGKGKGKRIDALRAAGLEDAAKLLEAERPGSPERAAPPEGAADVEGVPENVQHFLTRQLGYSPDEVAGMTREQAQAIGNQVRMHPGGTAAGIEAYRKPTPPSAAVPGTPKANLGETSARVPADELAKLLGIQERRTALAKTRVPAADVNVPRGTPPIAQRPEAVAAARAAAAEPKPAPSGPVTQSEAALAKARMTEGARQRAKLLENPTPENLDEYVRQMGEAADRQAQREFKGGTGKDDTLKVHQRSGEYLASGLGGLQQLYEANPKLFWTVMRTSGGALLGALTHKDDPLAGAVLGGLAGGLAGPLWRALRAKAPGVYSALKETLREPGAPIGKQPAAGPIDVVNDINPVKLLTQPHYALPDLWKTVREDLVSAHEAAQEPPPPGVTPAAWRSTTRKVWLSEAISNIDDYAREADKGGRYNAARYARAMSEALRGTPTIAERFVNAVSAGTIKPSMTRKVMRGLEGTLYNRLFVGALDTGLLTRSQVLAAIPQLGVKGVIAGIRAGRSALGPQLSAEANAGAPAYGPPGASKISNKSVRRFVDAAWSPASAAHAANRRDTYAAALMLAREAGQSRPDAHEWARDVTEQTHGVAGELGANPFLRHLGPLRMFTKWPTTMAQLIHAVATHPDPGVRRRGLTFAVGAGALGLGLGVNLLDLFLPHLRSAGGPTVAAVKDIYKHVTGSADHSVLEDLDPRRGGKALVGRYPYKVGHAVNEFAQHGFGSHVETNQEGFPTDTHPSLETFLGLTGLHTAPGLPDALGLRDSNEQSRRASLDDAYQFIANAHRQHGIESRLSKEDLSNAIAADDRDAAAQAAHGLTPTQLRAFYKARAQTRYQQLLRTVPVQDRAAFAQRFQGSLTGGQ